MNTIACSLELSLNRLNIRCERCIGGLLIPDQRISAIILVPDASGLAFDATSVQSVHAAFIAHAQQQPGLRWHDCPHLKHGVEIQLDRVPLISILSLANKLATGDIEFANACEITCVFKKQMDEGLQIIIHDIFGTTSTYGVGKRVLAGTADMHDLQLFKERLIRTHELLLSRQVNCQFISIERHPFPLCLKLLTAVRGMLESGHAEPLVVKNLLSQIHETLSQPRA